MASNIDMLDATNMSHHDQEREPEPPIKSPEIKPPTSDLDSEPAGQKIDPHKPARHNIRQAKSKVRDEEDEDQARSRWLAESKLTDEQRNKRKTLAPKRRYEGTNEHPAPPPSATNLPPNYKWAPPFDERFSPKSGAAKPGLSEKITYTPMSPSYDTVIQSDGSRMLVKKNADLPLPPWQTGKPYQPPPTLTWWYDPKNIKTAAVEAALAAPSYTAKPSIAPPSYSSQTTPRPWGGCGPDPLKDLVTATAAPTIHPFPSFAYGHQQPYHVEVDVPQLGDTWADAYLNESEVKKSKGALYVEDVKKTKYVWDHEQNEWMDAVLGYGTPFRFHRVAKAPILLEKEFSGEEEKGGSSDSEEEDSGEEESSEEEEEEESGEDGGEDLSEGDEMED
jgi:hypothetical protein